MSLLTRFFGKSEDTDQPGAPVAQRERDKDAAALQVLFATPTLPDPATVTAALRAYHPSMSAALCEIDASMSQEGNLIGLAGWGPHVLQLVGFNLPMPAQVVEHCVAPSHYPQALKDQARAHRAHALLYYVGQEKDILEQYVALAALAAALGQSGGIVVLNETAHTSFPAAALSAPQIEGDRLDLLRTLPLLILFCGFVKYNIPGSSNVWMRSYGAHLFGLPDLAILARGHHEGQRYFDLFGNILNYLRDSGATFGVGHTMQAGANTYLRCRAPTAEEPFLESAGEMFVLETIREDEINRRK
jgi:hypothetical protein